MASYTTNFSTWTELEAVLLAAQAYQSGGGYAAVESAANNLMAHLATDPISSSGTSIYLMLDYGGGVVAHVYGSDFGTPSAVINQIDITDGVYTLSMSGTVTGENTGAFTSYSFSGLGYSESGTGQIPIDETPMVLSSWSETLPTTLGSITFSGAGTSTTSGDSVTQTYTSASVADSVGHSAQFTELDYTFTSNESTLPDRQQMLLDILSGNDTAFGSATPDELRTYGGNDTLDGGGGIDTMAGGAGDDVYIVSQTTTGSLNTLELAGEAGSWYLNGQTTSVPFTTGQLFVNLQDRTNDNQIDYIFIFNSSNPSFSITFGTDQLGQNLAIGGYTNAERASFASPGHPGLDLGYDGRGANQITGNFALHAIEIDYGGTAPALQRLALQFEIHADGQTAATYGILNYNYTGTAGITDAVVEVPNEGTDEVRAGISYVLPDNVERLTLTGSANLSGAGNALANMVTGNDGNNEISGALGNDTLSGGQGMDTAVYSGLKAGYTVTRVGAGYTVTDTNMADGDDGTDTLTGIEWLQFSDSLQRLGLPQRDFNGDGKSDILIRNDSTGVLFQYQMNGTTILGTAVVDSPGTAWKVVGNGDYNGDGKSDILIRNDSTGVLFQFQMNGTAIGGTGVVPNAGTAWKVVGNGDYNGDGKSDILIRNDSTGVLVQFRMDGTTIVGMGVVDSPGTDWKVVGNGDYNGDGKSDILMRNDSTGVIFQYQMNGMTYASTAVVDSPGTDWKVVGSGDYNGDGKSDILIRNDSTGVLFQFQMNGTTILGTAVVDSPGTAWKVVGNGDYNGDGKSDILMRNDSTGVIFQYQMNGMTYASTAVVDSPGTDWKVSNPDTYTPPLPGNKTISDYNGDGKSDILIRNDSTGVLFQFQMNGTAIGGTGVVPNAGTAWKVVGNGDYNGDGKSDILIRNDSTGVLVQFRMDGTTIVGMGVVDSPGTDWKVVGNGDYNGDGKSDILMRNDSTGVIFQYQMNGMTYASTAVVDSPGTDWKVVGSGDYNGDGKSDILIRNDSTGVLFQFQMNGTAIGGTGVVPNAGTIWKVVGNGDFNGDGKSDILIRNDSTGVLVQFQMNGTAIVGMGVVDSPGTAWKVAGTGDYNGDGKSDILMRNDSTGVIFQYQMNGMTYAGTAVVDSPGTDWGVAL